VEFSYSPLAGIIGAAILGGAIGVQRQAAAKPAGFRTHVLVAAASAAFTAMGAHLHDTRIPSYVVVGIGFLGSGAIVREGATSRGLTTAASIWMAAAIGLVMGYSNSFGLFVALLATAITLVALVLSDSDLLRIFRIRRKATIRVMCASPRMTATEITRRFREARVSFDNGDIVSIENDGAEEIAQLVYLINVPPGLELSGIVEEIGALTAVRRVECAEPFSGG
jgi:putative Mg2+ transporter-C (MgtC) family protein